MFNRLLKLYPEITKADLKELGLNRYYSSKYKISVVAPLGWVTKRDKGNEILFIRPKNDKRIAKYGFKSLTKVFGNLKGAKAEDIIKKAYTLISELLEEEAIKNGDSSKKVVDLKIIKRGKLTVGHFVRRRVGKKSRWESSTILNDGKDIYILTVMSREKRLILGEFLSSLLVDSFCSEALK